jgi:glycosyltransferase involved in cell wall biosynthesis
MRILLSAYACNPDKGSESGVGWNWMQSLVKQGHEVCVITTTQNASAIKAVTAKEDIPADFVFYNLPDWCFGWKHWPVGRHIRTLIWWFCYLLWQFGAYRSAKKLHRARLFDVVHHITLVSFRGPSFMGGIGIPFIFGPVGGGETTPRRLRNSFNFSGRSLEMLRDLANIIVKFDPFMNYTFSTASLIACTTNETLERIPKRFHHKCIVQPAIGTNPVDMPVPSLLQDTEMSFLFIGRLLYWKGVHLVLRALPEVRQRFPRVRLKIVGEGKDMLWLQDVAAECGVASFVEWVPWIPHKDIAQQYQDNVAFVFPSFRDSGGMVVLEALSGRLPVICLNLGGPGVIVDSSCGISIDTAGANENTIQELLAEAMITLIEQPQLRESLAANCQSRAQQFSWDYASRQIYSSMLLPNYVEDFSQAH